MSTCSQAVILAAGIGSRLRPITLRKPKCSVTVDGTPLLVHQLDAYDEAGVSEVYVVAGYMRGQVERLCRRFESEHPGVRVTVIENEVYANTDNLYSLSLAADAVAGEEFLLNNGDVVYDHEITERVAEAPGSAIGADRATYSEEAMKITVDDSGRIDHISKDVSRMDAYAASVDLYKFDPYASSDLFDEVARIIEQREEYTGWTEIAIDNLCRSAVHEIRPADVTGLRWVEIDDYDDLTEADRTFGSLRNLGEKAAVFFDLDGTIYLDNELVEGAREVVETLRERGLAVYFLSNNSSKWKPDYAERLTRLGIETRPEEVLLSTDGVIRYLREKNARGVYVVGTRTMRRAMRENGVDVVEHGEDARHVVVGFDTELTYEKVREATLAVRDGAQFLLAHPDTVCPTADGFIPDCGSIGALVETATDRSPSHVFGKPSPEMIRHVLEEGGYAAEDVVVVGDRLPTELRMAERVGADSVCVLTGDADRVDIEESDISPSLVVPTVGDLLTVL